MHDTSAAPLDLRPFELLRDGFKLVAPRYAELMGALLLTGLLLGALSRVPYFGGLGILIVFSTANSGITWVLLRLAHGEKVSLRVFFEPMVQKPAHVFALHAIAVGLILLGLLCGVFPGLYLAVAFELSLPLLLTQDLTPWQALMRSRQQVHQQLGDFLLLSLSLVVINGIAALLVLPLGWTLPATCGATTLVAAQALGWGERRS